MLLEVTGECLINLLCVGDAFVEFLLSNGSRICHRAEDGNKKLNVIGFQLVEVEIRGWAIGLFLGHDDESAANHRLHGVIELSRHRGHAGEICGSTPSKPG